MSGSITVTTSQDRGLTKYSCAWTSDGSGDVSGIDVPVHVGQLVQAIMTPNTDGDQPTSLHDITLTLEGGGTDLLGGAGANVSNATPTVIGANRANLPTVVPSGNVRPVVANAGASKKGTIDLYISAEV